jgi:segregation and condensation protein B
MDLHIEALIFSSQEPLSLKDLKSVLDAAANESIDKNEILLSINRVEEKYSQAEYAIMIKEISDGYCFLTKPDYHDTLGIALKQNSKKKLSTSAMETLSIIAYKQDVTQSEVEQIRGVNCDYTIQKLLEKELVVIKGRAETPGRPLLYGTSAKFMDYFGMKSLKDLPKLQDFDTEENQVGEQAPIVDVVPLVEPTATEEE